jgi:glutamine synthetase
MLCDCYGACASAHARASAAATVPSCAPRDDSHARRRRHRSQFSGKDLLNGQTDGSSFPNGGLRATHTAGAFITADPESAPFIMGDCVYIPAVLAAYSGVSLDEKTPLHRSVQALSKEGTRLLGLLGVKTAGLVNNIGLEQEFFLISREAYFKRPDLQFTGRTVMGRSPARGQEMSDHYMAPLSSTTPALACMQVRCGCRMQRQRRRPAACSA